MALKAQLTGMRGVYLVAAELSRIGFVASPTSRSAGGADLLVTDQHCQRAYSVQVKTNASTFTFWLIGAKAKTIKSEAYVYVLVNLKETTKRGSEIEYFVVPSKDLTRLGWHKGNWPNIRRDKVLEYENAWHVFGAPK
jgi:hypothetical protein